jgi:hypothetical protein
MTKIALALMFLIAPSVFAAPPIHVEDDAPVSIKAESVTLVDSDKKVYIAKGGEWISDKKLVELESQDNKKLVTVAVVTALVSIVATGVVFSVVKK